MIVVFCESVGCRIHKYEAPANEASHAIYVRITLILTNSVGFDKNIVMSQLCVQTNSQQNACDLTVQP